MINTTQVIKLFKIFQFLWVFEFLNTLKNRTSKVRSTKISIKKKLVKETCYKPEAIYDIMHEPITLNIGRINAWTCCNASA